MDQDAQAVQIKVIKMKKCVVWSCSEKHAGFPFHALRLSYDFEFPPATNNSEELAMQREPITYVLRLPPFHVSFVVQQCLACHIDILRVLLGIRHWLTPKVTCDTDTSYP